MTDLILRDIDSRLAARIRRVAEANGWEGHDAILHLLEQSAVAALERVPDDPGFSLIGRVAGADHADDTRAEMTEEDFLRELDAAAAGLRPEDSASSG